MIFVQSDALNVWKLRRTDCSKTDYI